jgi:hypothetical protein
MTNDFYATLGRCDTTGFVKSARLRNRLDGAVWRQADGLFAAWTLNEKVGVYPDSRLAEAALRGTPDAERFLRRWRVRGRP